MPPSPLDPATIDRLGQALLARAEELAAITEQPGVVTRTFLTPEHAAANRLAARWMERAGMSVRQDAVGNLIGRYEGSGSGTVMIGSHLDTVRNAGKYDGILGVLSGIAAVEALHGQRLPFAIEVAGFADEEGVRFDAALTGSHALTGELGAAALARKDAGGMTLAEAIKAFGQDPVTLPSAAMKKGELLAYLEVHIEQGPVLERAGLPIGVVTAICGATRRRYRVKGMAGHAGTVPMEGRQDALVGAAEMVLAVEQVAREFGVVGTVGRIEALPGAVNVVPGAAAFTLDLRAERDADRHAALAALGPRLAGIAAARRLSLEEETFHDSPSCLCDPLVIALFERAAAAAGVTPRRLPSGAGHDAMAVAAIAPVGMLFVRCAGGISHNPAEAITAADAGLGQWALSAALDDLARGAYRAFR